MKIRPLLFALAIAAFAPLHAAPLELKKGDNVAFVGSGFADRQQHAAWFETLIYRAYPELDLTVRNLGFAADEVNVHPRSDEVPTLEYFLNMKPGLLKTVVLPTVSAPGGVRETKKGVEVVYHSGADFHANVIFAYWGFNESFKGAPGLADFKKALDEWLKTQLAADYGKGHPKVVLFSPIAHENLKSPNYPDGSANNKNLALYTDAMAEVAKADGVAFVDLYHPSLDLYAKAAHPLTINGIHLTEDGDKALAPVQFKAVFGKDAPATNEGRVLEIRAAVLDKNAEWHHRYRTVDQYNIYGSRSRIKYADPNDPKDAPDNATIMGEELAQRDVKTANRDKAVWAAAKGITYEVKDDNLPPVDKVPSNRFGPFPVQSKETATVNTDDKKPSPQAPLRPFIEKGEDTLKYIKVPEGCKVDFVASEKEFPELINPVQMNFDTKGRLWVAVWPNYPETTPTTKTFDKLLVFDIDPKTGKLTKCTTFADGLNCPTGFQFYKDGVLVMQSPNMLFLRDTDGDGKADWKERLVQGLDAADSHHETNSICYEPGGAVYFSDGVFHRSNVETLNGPIRNANGCIYRFEPRTSRFERYVPYGFANPHGRVFDYWGNDIITDATGNNSYFAPAFSGHLDNDPDVGSDNIKNRAHAAMKQFWNRPSRPCPGTNFLSSGHFPEDWQGQFLNGNVIGFQGIFRAKVSEDGAGLKGETIDPLVEGLLGDDTHEGNPNFRPSGIAVAPDGSLYFMDWSQMLIGHLQHHLRDPNRGHEHGRIYRITYPSRPLLTPKTIAGEPIPKLLDLLKEHEDNVRLRAKIELDTHDTKEVIPALDQWVKALDTKDPNYEHHRLEALWVHQWHNVVNLDLLHDVLKSPEPRARAQAVRVACYWRDRVPDAMAIFENAIKDSAPRVRLEGIRALSFVNGQDVPKAIELAKLVMAEKDYYIDYCFRETMKQLGSLPEGKDLVGKDPLLAARIRAMPDAKYGPTRKNLTKEEQSIYDHGKEVFNRDAHCVACHQPDGKGVENTYPPLAKSEWLDDNDRVIKIVLKGLFGPLKFQGKEYGPAHNTPPMIGFGPLDSDEDLAAAISYVHQSFGNDLNFVKAEDVKRVREQIKDRNIFYMVDEILKENPLPKKN